MARPYDIVTIAHGKLDQLGNMLWRAYNRLTGDDDIEDFGELPCYQALGVTSRPFPADADGEATGLVLRGAGNDLGALFGGRDTRCAGIYGALKDGDSCLHATGPDAIAQVQCKKNGQVVAFTKDSDGDGMIVVLDGENGKLQISYAGACLEIHKQSGHTLLTSPTGGASVQLLGDMMVLAGENVFMGDPNKALPVALADHVLTELAKLATAFNAHVHDAGVAGGGNVKDSTAKACTGPVGPPDKSYTPPAVQAIQSKRVSAE